MERRCVPSREAEIQCSSVNSIVSQTLGKENEKRTHIELASHKVFRENVRLSRGVCTRVGEDRLVAVAMEDRFDELNNSCSAMSVYTAIGESHTVQNAHTWRSK